MQDRAVFRKFGRLLEKAALGEAIFVIRDEERYLGVRREGFGKRRRLAPLSRGRAELAGC